MTVRGALLALCLLASACTSDGGRTASTTTVTEPDAPVPIDRAVPVGVAVAGGTAAGVARVESLAGEPVDLVRLFFRWDDPFPTADVQSFVDQGHQLHVSIRPRTRSGRDVAWADLADAEPGTALYGQLLAWADRLAELPTGTYVTLNHEPETSDSAPNGTVDDFIAMWRQFAALLDERDGGHLNLVWTMTGGAFRDGRAERWFPGEDVVDVVGADLYNWSTCQGSNRAWIEFERLLEEPLTFARERGKPLAVPEMASVEDPADPGRKGQWIDNLAATLAKPEIAADVEFVVWFDVTAPDGKYPNCQWDIDTSKASIDAFARLVSGS